MAEPRLAWLETPDRAVVWAVALGLQDEAEEVLKRSMEDLRAGRASAVYVPAWYGSSSGGGGGRLGRRRAGPHVGLADPEPRRDVRRARDDRQHAVLGERRRLLGRLVGGGGGGAGGGF